MRKTTLFILTLIGLFFIFFGFHKFFPEKNSSKKIVVFQRVVLSSQDQKSFDKITVGKETTALDLLRRKATVKTQGTDKNAFVLEINNLKARPDKKEYWAFYINNKLSKVGAGTYKLKPNDRIKWEIKTY